MTQALTVMNTAVRIHDGLYSLNDLHRASGGVKRHQPANWLRIDQARELIEEIKQSSDMRTEPVRTINGGPNRGTYACKELVYAYAMWISAKFHLAVIRAFDALVMGQAPALPAPDELLEDKRVIRAINRRAHVLAQAAEPELRRRLEALARDYLRQHPQTDLASFTGWLAGQTPLAQPAASTRSPRLPEPQAQALLEQIDPLLNMFHPFSAPFSHLMGVVRILRGQQPNTGLDEPDSWQLVERG